MSEDAEYMIIVKYIDAKTSQGGWGYTTTRSLRVTLDVFSEVLEFAQQQMHDKPEPILSADNGTYLYPEDTL